MWPTHTSPMKVLGRHVLIPALLDAPEQKGASLTTVRPKAPAADGHRPVPPAPDPADKAARSERFLPKRLTPGLRGMQQMSEFRALLATGQPIGLEQLPPDLLLKLEAALEGPRRGLVQSPHPGMREGVFDFARLHVASDAQLDAVDAYLEPSFVRRPVADKAATIEALGPLLLPGGREALERFHLPRPFSSDRAGKPLTFSMEAEAGLAGRPETLNYYGPDPSGKLDPSLMSDAFVSKLTMNGANKQAWLRMTPDQRRGQLTWGRLPASSRIQYLQAYQSQVDEKVTLRRLTNPKQVPNRSPLPDTLCDVLVWEGSPLRCAEIITEEHSPTLDMLFADVDAVTKIGKKQPGFHIHQVVELSTPEEVKALGPKITGLAALQDLQIFAQGVRRGSTLPTHTHLEVWSAEGIDDVARSFEGGKIESDAIDIHKFHCVGMREGIYGDDKRLGIEIRAVRVGRNQELARVAQRAADILTDHLEAVPAPPWGEWDAGRDGVADRVYEQMRADPDRADELKGAELSFSEVLSFCSGEHPDRDGWKYASPFWAFESLPGVTKEEAETIQASREDFAEYLMQLSESFTQAVQAGREIDGETNKAMVDLAMSAFFAETKVDEIIDRALDRIAAGEKP